MWRGLEGVGAGISGGVHRWLMALAAMVLVTGVVGPAGAAGAAPVVPMPEPLAAASWGQQPPGDGSAAVSAVPVALLRSGVLAGETVGQVDAGRTGGCAVTLAGKVACWGTGFLGDGTGNASAVP
ncbi:MAG: Fibronectin type-III protein, partial [Actinomycetota bacterium]|nr:Fibronectin type-III protein [Actinomycetota bacterium]